MSKVWMIVCDDMSAPCVAHVAGPDAKALVFGSLERAQATARLAGVSSVVRFDVEAKPAEAYEMAVASLAEVEKPNAIVASDNPEARALCGAIAARLGAVCASQVISVDASGDAVRFENLAAEQSLVCVKTSDVPVVAIISDGLDEAQIGDEAPIEETAESNADDGMALVATNAEAGGGADLLHADRVVSAGRGIGSKENLSIIDDLADALHAEIACTLPLSDTMRWFDHGRVVGTSTQKISPRLYVACASSGAPQHMAGVRGAKVIVAINSDAEAPIFKQCSYGIVGDAMKVVPVLTQALKNA